MKERKIGEIFEYNGEWYQVLGASINAHSCNGCQGCKGIGGPRIFGGECNGNARLDGKFVIFKKLKKVEKPYKYYIKCVEGIDSVIVQEYILANPSYIWDDSQEVFVKDCHNGRVAIEIKQNKDMEEKKIQHYDCFFNEKSSKSNLEPFDLNAAKAGKPVCTRDGRKARIICYDKLDDKPIIALVLNYEKKEVIYNYYDNGRLLMGTISNDDLMMLPEKKEGWVNIYKNQIHDTLKSAEEGHKGITDYIKTIKIEWEE